jgi:hypothetical protein
MEVQAVCSVADHFFQPVFDPTIAVPARLTDSLVKRPGKSRVSDGILFAFDESVWRGNRVTG